MSKRRLIILGVDGLGPASLPHLCKLMPKTGKYLARLDYKQINSMPHTSAQAIWAELLTGRPWYENGCAGFSKPNQSLQKLDVFTEGDLLAPVALLSGVHNVAVNIPLLRASDGNRDFLSDGSTPSGKFVSPTSLLKDHEILSQYRPRPYVSTVHAIPHSLEAVSRCIETERVRAKCAIDLFDRPWERFVLRVTVFDHLAHLFGPDVLAQSTLKSFEAIRTFLLELDDSLDTFMRAAHFRDIDLYFLSTHSHVNGVARINLNRTMQSGGFFTADKNEKQATGCATSRANEVTLAVSQIAKTVKVIPRQQSISAPYGIAASPVSACIFINNEGRFYDGAVPGSTFDETKDAMIGFLRSRLKQRFDGAMVIANPSVGNNISIAPDAIVYADGVEFYDFVDDNNSVPRAVHAPYGFVFLPRSDNDDETVTPIELSAIIRSRADLAQHRTKGVTTFFQIV